MMESVSTTSNSDAPSGAHELLGLLESVRESLAAVKLPLQLPGTEEARGSITAALAQLDDYILPRCRSLDAPLLAVVGGSTGAGKSTLVNALAGHPVTRAGAIRPTTRQPILLHHSGDRRWFADQRVLPGLSRVTGVVLKDGRSPQPPSRRPAVEPPSRRPEAQPAASLMLVADESIPRGLALLDAPDIDSIADENRRLAGQLLAAADLWLFVTTANRYADAVPWRLLLDAASRDIVVGVVLDRVPPEAEEEVRADLAGMLARQGLGQARLFVIHEQNLGSTGMLPPHAVEPVRTWLTHLAADAAGRSRIARRTLTGAVRSLGGTIQAVADAGQQQLAAGDRLAVDAASAYKDGLARILAAARDGTLLRGEVLARWQDFVGTGEFFRALESGIGRLRDRIGAFFAGKPTPAVTVEAAIESGLQAVIVDEAAKAAETADQRWRDDPAGRQLLGADDLSSTSPDFPAAVAAQIRAWQGDLMELIRSEGAGKRSVARMLSFGVNGLAVALMVVVFASTAGLTGLEVGIAGGSAIVGQKLLEAVFGEDAVRRLARTAQGNLARRCTVLMKAEEQRFLDRLDVLRTETPAGTLRAQADRLARLELPAAAGEGQG